MASERLHLRMSREERADLNRAAAMAGKSVSDYVRNAVFRSLVTQQLIAQIESTAIESREQLSAQIAALRDQLNDAGVAAKGEEVSDDAGAVVVREVGAAIVEALVQVTGDQQVKARLNFLSAMILSGETIPLLNRRERV